MRLIRRGGYYISGIRIDKPSPDRVIIPAVQVVQPRFGVVDIPAIAQGIRSAEGGGHGAVGGHGRAPGVIGVGHHLGAAGVHKTGDIALGVFQVEIPVAVVRRAVDRLGNAFSVGIVAVGDAAAALAHGRQLTAMLPGIRPRSVVQGVAYGVVGDGFPIERRQQVRPIGVAVAAPGGDEAPPGTSFRG